MVTIKRRLRLGSGRIVEGELSGRSGGDVSGIRWKKGKKWVSTDDKEGRGKGVFPICSTTKTPFVDIEVCKTKTTKRKTKRRRRTILRYPSFF